MANRKMVQVTINDEIYQELIEKLSEIQLREMIDQKWYIAEREVVKIRLSERYEWLRSNCL